MSLSPPPLPLRLMCNCESVSHLHDGLPDAVLPGKIQEGQDAHVTELLAPHVHEMTLLEVLVHLRLPIVVQSEDAREIALARRGTHEKEEENSQREQHDLAVA